MIIRKEVKRTFGEREILVGNLSSLGVKKFSVSVGSQSKRLRIVYLFDHKSS